MAEPIVIAAGVVIGLILLPVVIYGTSQLWTYGKLKAQAKFRKREKQNESSRKRNPSA